MDAQLQQLINELKTKLNLQQDPNELEVLDKSFRELKTELLIKRNQVKQLTEDLEKANSTIFDLSKELNNCKKCAEGSQWTLHQHLQKFKAMEEQHIEMMSDRSKLLQQQKFSDAEIASLKDVNQALVKENTALTRKVEALTTKNQYQSMFQDQLATRENKITSSIGVLKTDLQKLKTEQDFLRNLGNKVVALTKQVEISEKLTIENNKLKADKQNYLEQFVKIKACQEKLENLLTQNMEINKPCLFKDIILDRWKKSQTQYSDTCKKLNEIVTKLAQELKAEKTLNGQLIVDMEKLEKLHLNPQASDVVIKIE